jgi:hypothetical protein
MGNVNVKDQERKQRRYEITKDVLLVLVPRYEECGRLNELAPTAVLIADLILACLEKE